MNKKIVYSVVSAGLLFASTYVLAQSIPAYGPSSFNSLLDTIATQLTDIVGALAGIMFIISGVLYLTSAGSPERIGVAKKAFIYAIIGAVIALAAHALVDIITSIAGQGVGGG